MVAALWSMFFRLTRLAQLGQNPESRLGMDKGNLAIMGAGSRLSIDHLRIVFDQMRNHAGNIIDIIGEMMEARAFFSMNFAMGLSGAVGSINSIWYLTGSKYRHFSEPAPCQESASGFSRRNQFANTP